MKLVLLPQAQADLDEIRDPLLSEMFARLDILRDYPTIGAPIGGPYQGWRSIVVGMFRVVYCLKPGDLIEVIYIRDCRRRPLK